MSLHNRLKVGLLLSSAFVAVAVLLPVVVRAAVPAAVETYSYSDSTSGQPVGPLKPGDLTLGDVLSTHAKRDKPKDAAAAATKDIKAPEIAVGTKTSSASSSTEGVMLMQGMKTVLQKSGEDTGPVIRPPQLPAVATHAPVQPNAQSSVTPNKDEKKAEAAGEVISLSPLVAPPLAKDATAQGAVKYEDGRGPKDLNSYIAPQGAAPAASATANSACSEQVQSWTKTCAEAGYGAEASGEVKGETRKNCVTGALRDVWISNTCAASAAAPASDASAPASPAIVAPMPAAPTVPLMVNERTDGSCGPVNGLAAFGAPAADLCAAGMATAVTGSGPWRWSCMGAYGGMTVSCAAPVAAVPENAETTANKTTEAHVVEDGACGAANAKGAGQAPLSDLCTKGVASKVSGDGPWTWACSGINGGSAAACSASLIADGACGDANGVGSAGMPVAELCAKGFASAVTGEGPWNWTCSGLNGGAAATCSAPTKGDAVCGPSSLIGHKTAPTNGLCSVGTASALSGSGPWTWTCAGMSGGADVECKAEISANGVCGSANGVATQSTPDENLCDTGTPSRVTGAGPWNWTCLGTHGGDAATCVAAKGAAPSLAQAPKSLPAAMAPAATALGQSDDCGSAAELAAISKPTDGLCRKGEASAVRGDGPWAWDCTTAGGHVSSCVTLSPLSPAEMAKPVAETSKQAPAQALNQVAAEKAECGAANGRGFTEAPTDNLCLMGKASAVKGKGPWAWSCVLGKDKTSCNALRQVAAECGAANGSIQRYVPTTGLCASGTPTAVQGDGPWLWSCIGSGGGASTSCSATSEAAARVDGMCGVAASTPMTTTPAANLCDSGVPSRVYGEGPWTWTCSGLNGGIASSCSTQKNVPPPPAPPGPVVNGLCGDANGATAQLQPLENLCTTGTATAVSGNGPWNWNCLGENGGMTVSCTALLQPPAPITGVCGSASGVPTLTTPRSGLCSAGISSAVSGKGPWTWSCSGTNGGGAVACVAPLAGMGAGGSLPSLVTTGDAPAPSAASVPAVSSSLLVTPKLPSGPLMPTETGNFPPPPTPSSIPSRPAEAPVYKPTLPELPSETTPLTPPPERDTVIPPAALKPPVVNSEGQVIPGNKFVLDEGVSTVPFAKGESNIGPAATNILDKLANTLNANGGVRITLTAYADADGTTPREARRLSLSRALTVRDYLTSKGVSSARVDVRALGANVQSGDADRVDIKAN